ncbi:MAG: zf-HC2 domain-containing protein [Planctomycetaceae bacterium]|nr:zf-HC2 domain-containing protein [Planctomycetaceae bacterium]
MICADARHLIHLDAGGDLPHDEEHALAGHMEKCSECRAYNSGMLQAMSALHVLRDFDPGTTEYRSVTVQGADSIRSDASSSRSGSVWSRISDRLPQRKPQFVVRKQFNTRVAALCVCSLALAVISIVSNLPVANIGSDGYAHVSSLTPQYSAQPVVNAPQAMPVANAQQANNNAFPVLNPDGSLAGYLRFQPNDLVPMPDIAGKSADSF